MDWKEFFRFNFKKGWIFLILFILLVFSWFVLGMFQKTGASESIFRIVLLFIFALPISIVDRTFGTQGISSIWIIIMFVIEFIYLYLLTCIIAHLWKGKNSS